MNLLVLFKRAATTTTSLEEESHLSISSPLSPEIGVDYPTYMCGC